HAVLGVSLQTVQNHGLTSEDVAREMAVGALRASAATIALANTGLADADGDMDDVVCFACAMGIEGNARVVSETVKFDGERNAVRQAAARHGLLHLPDYYQRLSKAGA